MPLLDSFEISAFRGLHSVRLENCAAVNLLVGENNSGKTTVLEALALFLRPDDVAWWIDTLWHREVKGARTSEREVIKFAFPQHGAALEEELFAGGLKIAGAIQVAPDRAEFKGRQVEAQLREQRIAIRDLDFYRMPRADGSKPLPPPEFGEARTSIAANFGISIPSDDGVSPVWHQFSDDGALPYPSGNPERRLPCTYVTTVAHRTESLADRLGAAFLQDRREAITQMLRALQPTLETFEAVPREGQRPQIWIRDGRAGWLPLAVAGDGLRRAFHFAVAAANAAGGVLLIDEIESALHTTALRKVFGFLVRECLALNVQIFATTHSLEALDAVVEECSGTIENVAAFVLKCGQLPRRISGKKLRTIRSEYGYDVR